MTAFRFGSPFRGYFDIFVRFVWEVRGWRSASNGIRGFINYMLLRSLLLARSGAGGIFPDFFLALHRFFVQEWEVIQFFCLTA